MFVDDKHVQSLVLAKVKKRNLSPRMRVVFSVTVVKLFYALLIRRVLRVANASTFTNFCGDTSNVLLLLLLLLGLLLFIITCRVSILI